MGALAHWIESEHPRGFHGRFAAASSSPGKGKLARAKSRHERRKALAHYQNAYGGRSASAWRAVHDGDY